MSQRYVHTKILRQLRADPRFPNLKILDLSCGDALLLSELAALGCDCTGTRFCEDDYILKNKEVHPKVRIVDGVDLSRPLPFEDASFDIVLMKEVIEHLPSHVRILEEIGRIVRPQGWFLFSTPNIHRLHSRLHFLLTGAHKLKRRRVGWDLRAADMYAYHYNPVDFPIVHTMLHQYGFRIKQMPLTSYKFKSIFLMPLYPLIILASLIEYRYHTKRASASKEGEADLRFWMLRPTMLLSEQLLVISAKRASNEKAVAV